jgi:hypothetical protein
VSAKIGTFFISASELEKKIKKNHSTKRSFRKSKLYLLFLQIIAQFLMLLLDQEKKLILI